MISKKRGGGGREHLRRRKMSEENISENEGNVEHRKKEGKKERKVGEGQ